jgi:serine phosphatase RsbU (regulator of sigma subunit)
MSVQDTAGTGTPVQDVGPIEVLLIEDDDGDAFLVAELLREATTLIRLRRARSLAQAAPLLAGAMCVLLDLNLPDATGLEGLRWMRQNAVDTAVVVLTGHTDEHLGARAVGAGAQDYLVKGQVDSQLLYRIIRYSVERRRHEETQRQLGEARMYAQENARLARGLLPSPLVSDPRVGVVTRYRPGAQQMLLGGDFYDVVQAEDGWVHAMVGDVCGHGPDEAALGVCLRVAWRTLVLAGRPIAEMLTTLSRVFEHERHRPSLFATLCMVSVAPDRASARLQLCGHPAPLLITPAGVTQLAAPICLPLGIGAERIWPGADIPLGERWSMLLYTDGLEESRIGPGSERLGSERLMAMIESFLPAAPIGPGHTRHRDHWLLDVLLDRIQQLNQGEFDDDVAMLALSNDPGAGE